MEDRKHSTRGVVGRWITLRHSVEVCGDCRAPGFVIFERQQAPCCFSSARDINRGPMSADG